MNQPVALMTEQDARRYRFLIENLTRLRFAQDDNDRWIVQHWDRAGKGAGETLVDAIDDFIRVTQWEPKS